MAPTTATASGSSNGFVRPLSDDEIVVSTPDGHKVAFDVMRAVHHTTSSVQHAEFWLADVRWFSTSTLPIALAAAVFSTIAITYDRDIWLVLTLQLCVTVALVATWLMVVWGARLFWYIVAFYFTLCSLMTTVLALILWLALYARDLLHSHAWVWWTLTAVLILEVMVFVSILMALASITSCGKVLHQFSHLAADINALGEASALPGAPSVAAASSYAKSAAAAAADVKKTN